MNIDRLFKVDIRILQSIRRSGKFRTRTKPGYWDRHEWNTVRKAVERLLVLELIKTDHWDGAYTVYTAPG